MDPVYWKSILLGIVQGITEFLPVSSTGHLILTGKLLALEEQESSFTSLYHVVIQFSSILAVLLYFRKTLLPEGLFREKEVLRKSFRLWLKILWGVIPALGIGFLLRNHVEEWQKNPFIVASSLMIGGAVLLFIEDLFRKKVPEDSMENFSWKKALGVGFFQCLALIPGVSRSASTIIGGLTLGASRRLAAEFSFFLAIPTMAAASSYSLLRHGTMLDSRQWIALGIGFGVSFIVSWAVIAWLMEFIRKRSFKVFGIYRILLGLVVFAYFLFFR